MIAEIVAGLLHTMRRPTRRHTVASTSLGEELGPPFTRDRGGPGGWVILDEPEVHLGTMPGIVVSDLAGWRREPMTDAIGDDREGERSLLLGVHHAKEHGRSDHDPARLRRDIPAEQFAESFASELSPSPTLSGLIAPGE